jgi:serine phosphatase RsbU (regulator of sigma subunit)
VVDTFDNRLSYSVAGHLPMPILCAAGKAEYLLGQGKPVGIFKDVEWPVYQRDLPEKFELACFSDGVLEILPPDDLCSKEEYLLDFR